MKIYLLAIIVISGMLGTAARAVHAQTGPLIKMRERMKPIADVFNQPNLLDNQDPQAALVLLVVEIIRIFLGFLAILLVILIIYGGYLWMTAAGNEQRVEEAQNVIRRAVIGVVIILAAAVITNYVLITVFNATIN